MNVKKLLAWVLMTMLVSACQEKPESGMATGPEPSGKLFIIGGGKRPLPLLERMVAEAGVADTGYVLVMPMASEFEDTAVYYSSKQFDGLVKKPVRWVNSSMVNEAPDSVKQMLRNAALVYISGGDQARFMGCIEGTGIADVIREAYMEGAMIAGTSAGAAVMSSRMITGDQLKHPVYTGDFQTIEANNIVLEPGLGLIGNAIIDQHFVKRQRLNRLIAVVLENPEELGIGIDESTALLVKDGHGEVVGSSQVIVLRHTNRETKIVNGLLGGEDLDLDIYLPGDTIALQ